MALQKDITNPATGVVAQYWRAGTVQINPVQGYAVFTLLGYLSSDIRQQVGGKHVDERTFRVEGADFAALVTTPNGGTTPFGAVATAIYQHIKTATRVVPGSPPLPSEFADAEDV